MKKRLDRRQLVFLTFSVILVFIFSIVTYAAWADRQYKKQINEQLLERARMLASQYVEYESLRPFIMMRAREEVLYQVKLISLNLIVGIGAPDQFEIDSLQKFRSDRKIVEIFKDDRLMGKPVFRYIKPFELKGLNAAVSLIISKESLLKAYGENISGLVIFSLSVIVFTIILVSLLLSRVVGMTFDLDSKNDELVKLQKFREDLTGMLVHDLKNPLAGVIESLSIMKSGLIGQMNDNQRLLVNNAKEAADRLLRMIMNMLDISRMEEGKMQLSRTEVDIDAFLARAVEKQSQMAAKEGKKIVLLSRSTGLRINADEALLERVMENLLSNSLKHTLANEGLIEVSARREGGNLVASVKDNGEGIPAQYLDKVFEKFVQVESRKLGTKLDTGLGLTFCKLAVEAHGGRIWAESAEGRGSTFIFTIPVLT